MTALRVQMQRTRFKHDLVEVYSAERNEVYYLDKFYSFDSYPKEFDVNENLLCDLLGW